jgi:hypothetical protein
MYGRYQRHPPFNTNWWNKSTETFSDAEGGTGNVYAAAILDSVSAIIRMLAYRDFAGTEENAAEFRGVFE